MYTLGRANIPLFLIFVDDCLERFDHTRRTKALQRGGFSSNATKKRAKRARQLAKQVWIRWIRTHEGEGFGDSEEEAYSMGRKISLVRHRHLARTLAKEEGRDIFSGKWEWIVGGHSLLKELGATDAFCLV